MDTDKERSDFFEYNPRFVEVESEKEESINTDGYFVRVFINIKKNLKQPRRTLWLRADVDSDYCVAGFPGYTCGLVRDIREATSFDSIEEAAGRFYIWLTVAMDTEPELRARLGSCSVRLINKKRQVKHLFPLDAMREKGLDLARKRN